MELKYTNVTIVNLMVVYFDELYNSLGWLFNIQILYSYKISEEIYFKIFFYNSLLLFLVCIVNCIVLFFLNTSNKLWRQTLIYIFIPFILSIITPKLLDIYLNSKFRNDILYSKIEKNVMDFNEKIENFQDKIRDKIFPDRKSKDKDLDTINHTKRTSKFE